MLPGPHPARINDVKGVKHFLQVLYRNIFLIMVLMKMKLMLKVLTSITKLEIKRRIYLNKLQFVEKKEVNHSMLCKDKTGCYHKIHQK